MIALLAFATKAFVLVTKFIPQTVLADGNMDCVYVLASGVIAAIMMANAAPVKGFAIRIPAREATVLFL